MNKSITAIVLKSEDYRDFDKKLKLFTENGEVMSVIIRGVKKSNAKLRYVAQPFSFCNFELSGRGNSSNVVTGATVIEDLFKIADYNVYTAGCVMLEAAEKACEIQPNKELFLLLLRRIKDLLYGDYDPLISAISYLQNAIHKSGYSYMYDKPISNPTSVIELLACTENLSVQFTASKELIAKTFNKITARFEEKFSCILISKAYII
ncbi:MAG: DNA repair protein RecO [Clostridia bacterium]|nr:DNA repair protein RecO [Clostridia bacterium]